MKTVLNENYIITSSNNNFKFSKHKNNFNSMHRIIKFKILCIMQNCRNLLLQHKQLRTFIETSSY